MDRSELPFTLQASTMSHLNLVPKYAKYKPRINLEILSARKASIMLVLTYFMFVASVVVVVLVSVLLDNIHENFLYPSCCSSLSYTTNFTVTYLPVSFTYLMLVKQTNFTSLIGFEFGSQPDVCSPVDVLYTSNVWVCFDKNGCTGSQLFNDASSNIWQHLQFYSNVETTNMCALRSSNEFTITIIPKIIHVTVSTNTISLVI